mgnify:CR=1 FL=1
MGCGCEFVTNIQFVHTRQQNIRYCSQKKGTHFSSHSLLAAKNNQALTKRVFVGIAHGKWRPQYRKTERHIRITTDIQILNSGYLLRKREELFAKDLTIIFFQIIFVASKTIKNMMKNNLPPPILRSVLWFKGLSSQKASKHSRWIHSFVVAV